MKTRLPILGFAVLLTTAIVLTLASASQPPEAPPLSDAERLARGRYLVTRIGLCIDCHSPRDEKGEHIPSQHLTGAPIPFAPTAPMPWMPYAPRLAGLPAGFSEKELTHFLMTGERPNGRPPTLPPMPPYRFEQADAEAVVAYLKSLPTE